MKELVIKKCLKCGSLVKVIKDCECDNCGIKCCGQQMKEIKANSVDTVVEKHQPSYTFQNDKLVVTVNHVMDEDHYIEWLCLITPDKEEYVYFKPGDEPKAIFDNVNNGKIYSLCNKHGLWEIDIK